MSYMRQVGESVLILDLLTLPELIFPVAQVAPCAEDV